MSPSRHPEAGAALTELALLLPVLLLLSGGVVLLGELAEVKLAALEAARFLAWEKTVHRPTGELLEAARARYGRELPRTLGRTFLVLAPPRLEARLDDAAPAPFAGRLPGVRGEAPPRGRVALPSFGGLLEGAGLPAAGRAVAVAGYRLEALRGLGPARLPGGPWQLEARHAVLHDTWRAWPRPDAPAPGQPPTPDPIASYPLAEALVARRVRGLAFAGLQAGALSDDLRDAGARLRLPSPFSVAPATQGGPVVLRPAGPADLPPFSPGAGLPATRLGGLWGPAVFPSPHGVDRSRYTLPFTFGTGHWWRDDGGARVKPLRPAQLQNDYWRTWQCRGPFDGGALDPRGRLASGSLCEDRRQPPGLGLADLVGGAP